ncbi:ADP-ribosyltransferase [Paenibacillus alvei]|uniref:ADP-ribosyltransferase n=1 Tax=Paenibacillus alvei TaxID=44250 RepID=A0ABT4H548_PAEAL|nr:ADP-ribosyltransferase [Paenibacillus alvei]EJW20255.1 ADP-ribosyltransferase [Paenibacillus alvei DSM 29]MCY7488089.1 ADP-ribosyltransferase [Paenibacillus alvei]MCY9544063.1 ADP-ribosyltransferase [Paenibacillus alvei]MCY9702639.1 ADP-ribosyltransferase [Paenibacillus alvei]MCY9734144.1 ADP-ribosyltransferase [Paenibacillus alvei]
MIDFRIDTVKAKKWGEKKYSRWKSALTENEKGQITDYTKNANPINSYLRENNGNLGANPNMDEKIELLDKALNKSKLNDTITVYRGTDGIIFGEEFQTTLMKGNKVNEEVARKIKGQFEGTMLLERGYLSTSIVLGNNFLARNVLIELKVPKGESAGYVDPISYFPGQLEMLLPRNTQYYIDNIRTIVNGGSQRLKVEARIIK